MDEAQFCAAVKAEFAKHSGPGMKAQAIDWAKLFAFIQQILPFILPFLQPKTP